jgi:hypothetical protein
VSGEEAQQDEWLVKGIVLRVGTEKWGNSVGVIRSEHVIVRRQTDAAQRFGSLRVVADGTWVIADLGGRKHSAEEHHISSRCWL